jgi:hypothetical protein
MSSLALIAVILPLSEHAELPVLPLLAVAIVVYAASYWMFHKLFKQTAVLHELPETVMN